MLLKATLKVSLYLDNESWLKGCYLYACCQWDIFVWFSTTMLYSTADAHFGPSQASKMDLFTKIVNGFKVTLMQIWKIPYMFVFI